MAENKDLVVEPGIGQRANQIVVSGDRGALVFEKFQEIVDFSLYMSKSDKAVPAFLRGNAGSCMAVVIQANEWGFSPFAVARMAYVVNDQIAYMAQLIHAVIEKRAPLKQRLRFDYDGDGPEMRVTVTGHFRNEVDPLTYVSPRVKDIKVKNSPLWTSDPGQQLSYYGSRAWSRRYCPEILLGVYDIDELPGTATQHVGAENAKDVTPEGEGLLHRLSVRAAAAAGFDATAVAATIDEASGRAPAVEAAPVQTTSAVPPSSPLETTAAMEVEAAPQPHGDSPPPPAAGAADSSEPSGPIPDGSAVVAAGENVGSLDPAATPEPPIVSAPVVPKDGRSYVAYVKAMLDMPGFGVEANVRDWWSKGRRLRTEIPNLSPEDADEAKRLVTEHIAKLKKAGEGA